MTMNIYLQVILIFPIFVKWAECQNSKSLLVDSLRKDLLLMENELWAFVLRQNKDDSGDSGVEIIKHFHAFDEKVQQMPQEILYGMNIPRKSEHFLIFYSDIRVIHDLYDKFRRYQSDYLSPVKKDYLEYRKEMSTSDMVDDILYDVKNNVNKITRQIMIETTKLIDDIFEMVSDENYICENPSQPSQQVFSNLYNLVSLTNLKGYILSQFAYMALRLQEKGNYTKSSVMARKDYRTKISGTFLVFKAVMDKSDTKIYRCDPKVHKEGKTYEQVTRLIQAHIQNEADLNPRRTCKETCDAYSFTRSYGCYDYKNDYCNYVKPCRGNIYNCRFVKSHLETCVSPESSYRRYEYIEYKGGILYGEKSTCKKRNVYSWLRGFVHCSNCLCFCDEEGRYSDRYFNLRPSTTDVNNNRVVTGMRFIKHNRIFHIQVQEGKLLPYGNIDQKTVRWVPVDEYSIYDYGIKRKVDYHVMNYNSRTMYLDNVKVNLPNYLITGARLILNGEDLQFQVIAHRCNFTTGKLYNGESSAIVNNYNRRHKISFYQPNIPTYSALSQPYFDSGRYIDFTYTDLNKDAGQTTIPFIDIQPVSAEPAVPLKSAGIYYKGNKGYGGFIGMRVDTFNFSSNLNFDFPKEESRQDSEEIFGVIPN